MVSFANGTNVGIRKLAVYAIDQSPQLPAVNEQGFAVALTELSVPLITSDEPEANRNLGAVEQLPWQRDHAIDKISFDDRLTNFPLAGLVR